MLEILHIGVPVKSPAGVECYNKELKVYVTDPERCKYRYQGVRFEHNTPLHDDIVNNIHVAYQVDNLKEYLEKYEVLQQPVNLDKKTRMAFVKIGGLVAELRETK